MKYIKRTASVASLPHPSFERFAIISVSPAFVMPTLLFSFYPSVFSNEKTAFILRTSSEKAALF